ncbi:CHAT domain-containing protein [Roseofilum capinflatum]|uniref:Tetratricopeptide repeat protein n=1 Tax=Roseofilum capinflatum BLCC-M114 TaxID=3022440 RepID=A0ABT7B7X7_9CYAN|nr:tetratricopeptide repeat protein [Roseofilum capinflatum]MDJ1175205.1 tetratricopeptide repeat protein [Roseofilum capinflatum BLCC-M114]
MRLLNRLFGKKRQPPQPDPQQPAPEPDNAECEAVFMALLEGVDQGWTRGNAKGFLIGKNIKEARMTAWLREFAERVRQNPEQHRELGRPLQNLGNLAWGELSPVAARLAQELVVVEEPGGEGREAEVDGDGLGTEEEEEKDEAEAWFERGKAEYMQGDFLGAIASYDQALEIKPDDHYAWNGRGVALGDLGRTEEAIASYDRALDIKPDFHQAWFNRGVALYALGRYEEAIASWDRALDIKPDYHEAWYNRGNALGDLGRNEEAIASYDRALESKPDFHDAWRNRGNALRDLGRNEEAIASFDRALESKPDFHEAWYNRGNALRDLGRKEEAIASYDRALEIKPDFHYAWNGRGNALYALGRNEEASASYDRALDIKPDFHYAWFNRGIALYALGRNEEAIASYDRALEFKPDKHEAWINRGIAAGNSSYSAPLQPSTLTLQYPQLDQRGFEGELASYHLGLTFCTQDQNPQGWGLLHRYIGRAYYYRGRKSLYPPDAGRSDFHKALNHYHQALQTLSPPQKAPSPLEEDKKAPSPLEENQKAPSPLEENQKAPSPLEENQKAPSPVGENQKAPSPVGEGVGGEGYNPEYHLELIRDLIRVYDALNNKDERKEWRNQGLDLWSQLLNHPHKSSQQKRQLAIKFIYFAQMRVDVLLEDNELLAAFRAAEEQKNLYLTWILDRQKQHILSPTYHDIQQNLLNPTTALILWHLSDLNLTTFLLLPDAPEPIPFTTSPKPLKRWFHNWETTYQQHRESKQNTHSTWRETLDEQLQQLQQLLDISTLCSHLPNTLDHLILIPHLDLHRLPLHTLFPDTFTLTTLPSAQVGIQKTPSPSLKAPSPVGEGVGGEGNSPVGEGVGGEGNSPVGEPVSAVADMKGGEGPTLLTDPPRNSLEDLPLAELEAQVIAHLCHPSHRIPSHNATPDTLKEHLAQPYHRFHFTGHASHDFKAPQDSRLLLTDDESLTLRDLIDRDFHLPPFALVSLSACETAVTSREAFDDDYVGLVSAFLSRGTRQVLSTLWTVEDRSNALFMIEFYRQLTQHNQPPTRAFHHTQHWLKHLTPSQLVTWYHQLGQIFLTEGETIEEENRRRRVMRQGKDLQQKSKVLQKAINEGELSPHDSLYSHPYYWAAFTLTHGNEQLTINN